MDCFIDLMNISFIHCIQKVSFVSIFEDLDITKGLWVCVIALKSICMP